MLDREFLRDIGVIDEKQGRLFEAWFETRVGTRSGCSGSELDLDPPGSGAAEADNEASQAVTATGAASSSGGPALMRGSPYEFSRAWAWRDVKISGGIVPEGPGERSV
jgi:hypothetical protein